MKEDPEKAIVDLPKAYGSLKHQNYLAKKYSIIKRSSIDMAGAIPI